MEKNKLIHLPELALDINQLKNHLDKNYSLLLTEKNIDESYNKNDNYKNDIVKKIKFAEVENNFINKNNNNSNMNFDKKHSGYDDRKMSMINCDIIHEYAVKLDKMIQEDTQLEEWVKMKLSKVELMIASVKHALVGIETNNDGGEIAKKQLLHIAKYSKKLHEMIEGGSELMSWMESNLAISADYMDNIYHHLDYKLLGNRASDNQMANGGGVGNSDMYVAIGEKNGYWVVLSKPSTREKAQELLDMTALPTGETGKIVTLEEAKSYKKIIGAEYLKYANGGGVESENNKYADGGSLGLVKVKFENPKYNYSTNVSGSTTEEDARKYFVGKMFDMGIYPNEDFQRVIDIEFFPKGTYKKGGFLDMFDSNKRVYKTGLSYKLDRAKHNKSEKWEVPMEKRKYADGGNVEIAKTILSQLGGMNKLIAMTGAYNFVALPNGVSFKIKNPKANYIKITLTSMDLYDLEVGRIRGTNYTVVKKESGLYFDMLKPTIEKATGMYLSLFKDGGNLENSKYLDDIKEVEKLVDAFSDRYSDILAFDEDFALSRIEIQDYLGYGAITYIPYIVQSNIEKKLSVGETSPKRMYLWLSSGINPSGITSKDDVNRTWNIHLEIKGVKRITQRTYDNDGVYFKIYEYGRSIEDVLDLVEDKMMKLKKLINEDDLSFSLIDNTYAKGGNVSQYVPVSEKIDNEEIEKFIEYVDMFYGKSQDAMGERGYSKSQIKSAILRYLKALGDSSFTYGYGDSLDRERVWMFLENPKLETLTNPILAKGGKIKDGEVLKVSDLKKGDRLKKKGSALEVDVLEVGNDWRSGHDYALIETPFGGSPKQYIDVSNFVLSDGSPKPQYAKGGQIEYINDLTEDEILKQTIVYDNGGESYDRYTVFTPDGSVYGMSENAWGFNMFIGDDTEIEKGSHLGKKLKSVPENIKLPVLQRMKNDTYAKGGEIDEIDMDEVEKSAIFYTDESHWTTKPTINKFEKEIKEYEELINKLDNKEITPSKIIGKGYKSQYARKLAYKWLNERILIAKRAIELIKMKS